MPATVVLTAAAKRDVAETRRYIAVRDSAQAAVDVLIGLRAAVNSLKTLPERGHATPEMVQLGVQAYREIHSGPYRIIYEVRESTVFIHAVLDGRRDLDLILQERLLR